MLVEISDQLAAVETAAEEEAALVKERARLESVRLKRSFLRLKAGVNGLASQISASGSMADDDRQDNSSSPRGSPDVEMADDFSIEAKDSHTAIQLQSDSLLAGDIHNGSTARGDNARDHAYSNPIPRGAMHTPNHRHTTRDPDVASTPTSDRMSTSPQRPQSPTPIRDGATPAHVGLSAGIRAPQKYRNATPEEDIDEFNAEEDSRDIWDENDKTHGIVRHNAAGTKLLGTGGSSARSISSDSSKRNARDDKEEASDDDNDGMETNKQPEDEVPAISEKQMRELAKSVTAGKVLDVADAHALRQALDQYRGPNKPNIDLFLLTKDVLQSKYHAKTYTQPMGGGIKATPNGAVELRTFITELRNSVMKADCYQ